MPGLWDVHPRTFTERAAVRMVRDLADLTGRVALVVGGGGHIGHVACATLAELGAQVVVADRPEAIEHMEGPVLGVDLNDVDETRALVPATLEVAGALDIIVHTAAYTGDAGGPGWATDFLDQSVEAWDRAHRVNVTSAFVLAQAAQPVLSSRGRGALVFVSSIYGVVAPDFSLYEGTDIRSPVGYAATKAGLIQLTRYLAALLAPDVRVNAISPGGVRRQQDMAFVARYEDGTPLGRMATEEDLKGAFAYLCSDLSAYVTGTNLLVDGGRTIS